MIFCFTAFKCFTINETFKVYNCYIFFFYRSIFNS